MALETSLRRRKRLSMTSLIDVIFLLLLFFMLTSTFSKYGEIELSTAGQGSNATEETQPHFLSLKDTGLLLDGVPTEIDALADALAAEDSDDPQLVLVSLSEQTTSQTLVDVLATLRGIGGIRAVVLQ